MFKSYQLNNGIRVILERIPHFRSASVGLWFGVGSVYEKPSEKGLSHFIEHMLFKGTTNRTAKQIAEAMDAVGGQLNAFTAKEYTCFYCKVMDEHIDLGLDLLSDMVLNSVFDEGEFEKEKGVIIEEINMYDDSPEDLVHELLAEAFFGQHPLASPILGTVDQLKKYKKDQLMNYMVKYYTPDNLVISIAGNFEEEDLMQIINKYFSNWNRQSKITIPKLVATNGTDIRFSKKDIEQVHLCLAGPGIAMGKEEIYPMLILNNIFGGGMSSRLFQKIREDRGLTYSVFSYPSSYLSTGMYSIYAGMKPSQASEVLKLVMDEIRLLREKGITNEEFNLAREQLKGNYILGIESTNSRMTAIGKSKLMHEKVMTPSEIIDKINRVTSDDVRKVIDVLFGSGELAAAMVGNEDMTDIIGEIIQEGI
ncbi:MAG: insulinase family protein [Firmicutes bacterium]|nr:insulinase family protein [Bacillota bacterium]